MPVLSHKIDYVVVIPQKQRTFRNLKVRRIDARRDLAEQGKHCLHKLRRLRQLQHFLKLTKEQHLLLAICDWPVLQKTTKHSVGKSRVLLNKLSDAI